MSIIEVTTIIGGKPYLVTMNDGTHQWLGDEPIEQGGADIGPSPTQLLLSSLGACTAITLRMYANRKQWPLEGVEVRVSLDVSDKSADGATEITRRIVLKGSLDTSQRERLLQIANACPIHKILTGNIRVGTDLADA
ncbi:MAG: OsmC family protein [Pseudomonadota bacterium]